ncbi:ribonuclease T2 isoform X2 [Neomonachus schauinslandi]|uniref:Ribonuclease T2 isoform X2 n=1 Tax=Neomonachus schauinslandi TaxID=29088 RepID=A0A2Y9HBR1_NEOSC|nr:ribonuclease T2 isoform X2 [Neomonachus schauinslandi]
MKPAAPHGLLLSSLCLALCCLGGARGSRRSDNHQWKKLIMVHHWPVTVCKEVENDCRDPPDYWTIHGLWPDKAEECNGSWPFNLEEIKDLLPEMKMYWPDVIHPLNHSHFWKHEWEKHGTCAAQVDALNSQKKYFGGSLDLYRGLELNSMLQKLGIKPSINYYQISDIKDALASIYGVVPKVQCLPPKQGEEVQTIGQIELCFTKELRLRNCTEPGEPGGPRGAGGPGLEVCEDGPAFYPPPQQTAP